MEILIVGVILILVFNYVGFFSFNKFVEDNNMLFERLKEKDYEFFLISKYGDKVDVKAKYQSRVKTAIVVFVIGIIVAMTSFQSLNFAVKLVLVLGVTFLIFKDDYSRVKNYYAVHLHDINLKLPYYLKSLEILIQHYTVPVALGKSLGDAPEIFQDGLRDMIEKINAGDSTINPYMEFAKDFPVRDSMRMMRLLYRLGLGKQERKQEQLLSFSKTISGLQQKAREARYKSRLDKMESKTMTMLVCTGVGVMLLLVLSILQTFS